MVKFCTPSIHTRLLQMLEWLAQTDPAALQDTWHIGHFMNEWLDPELYHRVQLCFAHFDAADSYRALIAITTLFRDVTEVVTGRLGYPDSLSLANTSLGLVMGYASHQDQSVPG